MEVNINKKDLRKIRHKLGRLVSNVNRAYFREQNNALTELINYIDGTPLLGEYIKSIEFEVEGLEEQVRKVHGSYGKEAINQGSDSEARTYILYLVFQQIVEQNLSTINFGWYYVRGSNKYQDMAEAFGTHMVYPFYAEVESYLTEIAIDMGYDENETKVFNIDVSGDGVQVNVASDHAKIEATQTNTWDKKHVEEEIKKLEEIIKINQSLPEAEVLDNNLQLLKAEIAEQKPKESVLKTTLLTLKSVAVGIAMYPDFINGITAIAELIGIQI